MTPIVTHHPALLNEDEVVVVEHKARRLFGDPVLQVRIFNRQIGIIVNDRLVLLDDDSDSWFVVWTPNPLRPWVLEYIGDPVTSIAEIEQRHPERPKRRRGRPPRH